MATMPNVALLLMLQLVFYGKVTAATWCVARNDAKEDALQTALDYACGAGADCAPLQDTGLCFLPNTIQAHASYAFNSFYMHSSMDSGACDFSGTAAIAKTDPSYGTCVYPSSPSTAGGGGGMMTPILSTPPQNFTLMDGGSGALTPTDMVPTLANPPSSEAFSKFSISRMLFMCMVLLLA
ncbi:PLASMODESMATA CALLOSE-BINDING PROTEIN 3 [Lactuca sativa]|uniref:PLASMODESMATA CALLOSE-BINDING PROTEIN 3 n=1 Tax=Lactuca sativa TaxID=4236 RepID=UPI000CD86428|nr:PLASMODESMATA CALLOSE-BINDING PROTEIN 3 [Lactuca sativa]